MSGVEVATMIRSMSCAVRPAASMAWRRGLDGQVAGVDLGRSDKVAGADAGALDDPLVGGLDALLCSQFGARSALVTGVRGGR